MECKKLTHSKLVTLLYLTIFMLLIYAQFWLWMSQISLISYVAIFIVNGILVFPNNILHENAHADILKRKRYKHKINLREICPNVQVFEPVPLNVYRNVLLAPFKLFLALSVVLVVIIFSLGNTLAPHITLFITMRMLFSFIGCARDLHSFWLTRATPDDFWAVDFGTVTYICPNKTDALELFSKKNPA